MSGYAETVLKSFNDQVRNIFVPAGVQNPDEFDVLKKAVGNTNASQLLYVEGGLFANCMLERPVMNVTITPKRSLANRIPVVRRNTQKSMYAFLTDIAEPSGSLPDYPCDDPQKVGNLTAAFIEVEKGRVSLGSQTLELDKIIQRYHQGITTDLYIVGDVRGVSAGIPAGMEDNLSLLSQAATRRQFQLIARGLQNEVLKQFWTGDPTNVALNTTNGGAKQFWGLEFLVADDYGTKTNVTGTNKTQLNSDIKDFESTCIGGQNANTGLGLYGYMTELEDTLTGKASLYGYNNVEWVWVMHPTHWSALVKYLPCEMLGDGCGSFLAGGAVANTNGVTVVSNDMGIATIRQQLQSTMRLTINGRSYMVILDDAMPLTITGTNPVSHTGDIYFIPLSVEGVPTLFWDSADYRAVAPALEPIPGGLGGLHGWVDGGIKLSTARHNGFCFDTQTKMELGLVFIAPHLAGKIENVVACALQQKTIFNDVTP
ncbi:MAG TPA: hypothetical protein PKN22_08555 [Taishania sp.]|nr:hypothetical protein [Taishania sp.]